MRSHWIHLHVRLGLESLRRRLKREFSRSRMFTFMYVKTGILRAASFPFAGVVAFGADEACFYGDRDRVRALHHQPLLSPPRPACVSFPASSSTQSLPPNYCIRSDTLGRCFKVATCLPESRETRYAYPRLKLHPSALALHVRPRLLLTSELHCFRVLDTCCYRPSLHHCYAAPFASVSSAHTLRPAAGLSVTQSLIMDSQPDFPAASQLSTQELELPSSQIQVPRSRDITPHGTQAQDTDADKLSLPASSITPPPSTQLSHAQIIARTPSPMSLPASPPPTTKEDQETLAHMASTNDIPTAEQVDGASMDELRQMVSELSLSLREARTSAAHYNLQHNMLKIESSKAHNAIVVEMDMMQRELDVLQEAELRRRGTASPRQSLEAAAHRDLINDLNRQINILNAEIQRQQVVIASHQRSLDTRNERLTTLEEQNERLRHRIRTNREHMNGLIDSVRDRSPISALNTPSRSYYNTPARVPITPSARRHRDTGNMAFDVLLLADKVISQETATAPSTPKSHGRGKASGHVRGTHSLSSLPSTPTRRPTTQHSAHTQPPPALRTPLHLSHLLDSAPPSAPQFHYAETPTSARRRRASSESTISIPDRDTGGATRAGASFTGDEIPESSASQAATSMLRSTTSSFGSKKASSQGKTLKQAKLAGRVAKPPATSSASLNKLLADEPVSPEKRRLVSGIAGAEVERGQQPVGAVLASPKKRKVGSDGVGLGIGI
jgi:hypothetical protein